jgi:hypothetical protein
VYKYTWKVCPGKCPSSDHVNENRQWVARQDGSILQQADNNLGRLSEKNITTIKSNFIVQNKRNVLNPNLNEMEIQFDGKVRLGVGGYDSVAVKRVLPIDTTSETIKPRK